MSHDALQGILPEEIPKVFLPFPFPHLDVRLMEESQEYWEEGLVRATVLKEVGMRDPKGAFCIDEYLVIPF